MPAASAAPTQRLMTDRLRRVLLTVGLLVVCYAYWHLMLRWFFLQRDDFWLISITDDPYGRYDLGEFLWRWWHDWSQRNGRSADALVRLLLRPGVPAMTWIAPAVITACCAAIWRWAPGRDRARPGVSIVAMILLLTVLPVLLLTIPSVSGTTVFWAAGIGNYVVPTGLALLAASWLPKPPRSPGMLLVAVASILLAGALHELAAATVFSISHVWWVLNRRSVTRTAAMLIVSSYAGLLLGLSGPGRWRRVDALVGEETGLARWVSAGARFTSELLLQAGPIWGVLLLGVLVAVVTTWRDQNVRHRQWLLIASGVAVLAGGLAWVLARSWRAGDLRCSQVVPLADDNAVAAVLMLASAALAVVALGVVLVLLRTALGDAPVLLGTGALATLPIPMITGLCATRVWFPPLVWTLTLLGVLLTLLVTRRYLPVLLLITVTAIGVLVAGRFLAIAEPALRANHASFEQVLEQIPATQQTGTGTITFPEEVPYPAFGKEPVYRLPSIACGFRTYYAVPDAVVLDNGQAPTSGLPEYCPRPDDPRRSGG